MSLNNLLNPEREVKVASSRILPFHTKVALLQDLTTFFHQDLRFRKPEHSGMKKGLLGSCLIVMSCLLYGQVYLEEKTQHRFAQTYFGINTQVVPSQGTIQWGGEQYRFPTLVSPRISIGGLHFWGKLDFNFNLPLARFFDPSLNADSDLFFSPGGDLSVRYYPWRMTYGKLRPYGGISVNTVLFGIENESLGDRFDGFVTTSLLSGLAFAYKDWQVSAEWMWLPDRTRTFYSDRTTKDQLKLPRVYFGFGLVKYVDFTLHNEKDKRSGRTKAVHEELKRTKKVNSISVGIAPSSAFFLKSPSYASGDRRSLPKHKGEVTWEFGVGYLFHNEGIHLGLSYRDYTSSVESYGLEHVFRRRSVALEGLFFLLDYNGFVPFVGPSVSYERWGVAEFEGNRQVGITRRTKKVSPGLIFGWDIVPSPIDTWVLRTNLRYYPFQRIEDVEGKRSRVDQFEFNFIQFVLYPNRILNVARAKRKF